MTGSTRGVGRGIAEHLSAVGYRVAVNGRSTSRVAEVVAEIETEKLNYDLEATEGGVFHSIVDEGATVAVDGLIVLGE